MVTARRYKRRSVEGDPTRNISVALRESELEVLESAEDSGLGSKSSIIGDALLAYGPLQPYIVSGGDDATTATESPAS